MKKIVAVLLATFMMIFSLAACGENSKSEKDTFASYQTEMCTYLDTLVDDADGNAIRVIVMQGKNEIKSVVWDENISLEQQKEKIDSIVEEIEYKIYAEKASVDNYIKNGYFIQDFNASVNIEETAAPSDSMLLVAGLLPEGETKNGLVSATKVGDYYESASVFFMPSGMVAFKYTYSDLFVDFFMALNPALNAADAKNEKIFGTYKFNSTPITGKVYSIEVSLDGQTDKLMFEFDVVNETLKTSNRFKNEVYYKDSEAIPPQKSIDDLLNANGYLLKKDILDPRSDYILNTECSVEFTAAELAKINALTDATLKTDMLNVTKAGDIFAESVVSFTEEGEAIISNCYTELGATYFGKNVDEPEEIYGTYTVAKTPNGETSDYNITVTASNHEAVVFTINAYSGKITRTDMFKSESFDLLTMSTMFTYSGGLYDGSIYDDFAWTEGVDGTTMKNVAYGNGERNVLDIFVPTGFENRQQNGVILFIHGGSWTSGNKEEMHNHCKMFAKMGYFTAAMNHTYGATDLGNGEKSTLITIDDEVNAVFAKIKELSQNNGWNITQAATSGYSSGCHVATLYAYGQGNETDAPIPVTFTFGMVGSLDFRPEYWENVATEGSGVAAIALNDNKLIRPAYNPDAPADAYSDEVFGEKVDRISPLSFARKGDAVPTVVAYGRLDTLLIDYVFAEALETELNEASIKNDCYVLPNSGHFTCSNPWYVRKYLDTCKEYLKEIFGY